MTWQRYICKDIRFWCRGRKKTERREKNSPEWKLVFTLMCIFSQTRLSRRREFKSPWWQWHDSFSTHTSTQTWPRVGSLLVPSLLMPQSQANYISPSVKKQIANHFKCTTMLTHCKVRWNAIFKMCFAILIINLSEHDMSHGWLRVADSHKLHVDLSSLLLHRYVGKHF